MDSHYYRGASYHVNATSPVSAGDYIDSPTFLEAPELARQPSDISSRGPLTPSSYGSSPGMSYSYTHNMSHSPTGDYGDGYDESYGGYYADEYASAASSSAQQASEPYYGNVDWSQYDYVPTEDGGYWQMKPRYVPAGQYPTVIPHQGLVNTEASDRDGQAVLTMLCAVAKSSKKSWTTNSPASRRDAQQTHSNARPTSRDTIDKSTKTRQRRKLTSATIQSAREEANHSDDGTTSEITCETITTKTFSSGAPTWTTAGSRDAISRRDGGGAQSA